MNPKDPREINDEIRFFKTTTTTKKASLSLPLGMEEELCMRKCLHSNSTHKKHHKQTIPYFQGARLKNKNKNMAGDRDGKKLIYTSPCNKESRTKYKHDFGNTPSIGKPKQM